MRKNGIRNGSAFEELVPFHKCTDVDYAGFYPLSKKSQTIFKTIREDPKKNLFCLDEYPEDFFIGGDSMTDE